MRLSISSSQLSAKYLEKHPVWLSAETEGADLVEPFEVDEALPKDVWAQIFMRADITCACGMELSGMVGVSDEEVYLLVIYFDDGDEINFNARMADRHFSIARDLVWRLKRPLEEIFPISYQCAFGFETGQPIKGVMEMPKKPPS